LGERRVHWNRDCFRAICMGTLPSLSIRSFGFILLAAAVVIPQQLLGCNAGCSLFVQIIAKKSAHSCCPETTVNLIGGHNSRSKQCPGQSSSHKDRCRMDSAFAQASESKGTQLRHSYQKAISGHVSASWAPTLSPILSVLPQESLPETKFLSLAPGSSPLRI